MTLADTVNYCPRCGALLDKDVSAPTARPQCSVCQWVYFADPKVAVAALIEQYGQVLLVRRANSPHKGEWTLPAGFLDAGEDPARAIERECLEETGLHVETVALLAIIAGQEHARGAHFVIAYRCKILGGNLFAGDDADAVGFFARDALPPLAFRATQEILGQLPD